MILELILFGEFISKLFEALLPEPLLTKAVFF